MDLNESFSSFNPEGDYQYYKENVPPGFRFDDSDNLIMLSYLRSKEQGHRLANIFFKQVSLYDYDPEELQSRFNNGKGDEMYFYTETKPLNNGWRVGRKAGNGRWKTKNGEKKITQGGETIGYKTTLSFYCGKEGKEKITCWIMQEYKLRRENRNRKRGDDVVLCKIYKRGGAEKTGEAIDEENNEETGGSIGSCNYLKSSTTVSNGLGQSFPDVHSLECFETEDLVTPTNGSIDLPMAPVNDPFQFAVSPVEDSATPMNIVYEDFPMAEVDDPFQFAGLPPIECLATLMNGWGDFSMVDLDDPFQFALPQPIKHLATLMNDWGDFTMADVNEPAIQFLGSPIEDFNSQMANVLWNS